MRFVTPWDLARPINVCSCTGRARRCAGRSKPTSKWTERGIENLGRSKAMSPSGGLTCREFVELATEYLEGTMSDEDRSRFEQHLAICPGCVTYVEQMRQTISL